MRIDCVLIFIGVKFRKKLSGSPRFKSVRCDHEQEYEQENESSA